MTVSKPFLSVSDVVKVVNIQGKLKSSKRQSSELHFDFTITAIGERRGLLDDDSYS